MTNDSLNELMLLRERIKCRKDSRYDNQFIELLDILIAGRQHQADQPQYLVERVAKAIFESRFPFSWEVASKRPATQNLGDDAEKCRRDAKAAIAAMGDDGLGTMSSVATLTPSPASDNQREMRYNEELEDALHCVEHNLAPDIVMTIRKHLRTTEPVEYAGFDSLGPEGQGAYHIGYNRGLADATPEPVSLKRCRNALSEALYQEGSDLDATKAVLDAAGVKCVD